MQRRYEATTVYDTDTVAVMKQKQNARKALARWYRDAALKYVSQQDGRDYKREQGLCWWQFKYPNLNANPTGTVIVEIWGYDDRAPAALHSRTAVKKSDLLKDK